MKEFDITLHVEQPLLSELTADERELIDNAVRATKNANAKYSGFCVGAAIRLADGRIVIGANQENASFPLSLCAERTAIFAAQAASPEQSVTTIAICARNAEGLLREPVTPCGSCRQVMVEMEDRYSNRLKVLLYGTEKIYRLSSARDLLPLCFVDANMHGSGSKTH
ncbi:MAG: cytidine deaminase [Prevotella sp.]|nr:cytidine deaminase [Prevotella sp.]